MNTDSVHFPVISGAVKRYLAGEITARMLEDSLPDGDASDGDGDWRQYALDVRLALGEWMKSASGAGTHFTKEGYDRSLSGWLDEHIHSRPAHSDLGEELRRVTAIHHVLKAV